MEETGKEKRIFRDIRWWSLQELLTTRETVHPRTLSKEPDSVCKGGRLPKEIVL